VEFAARIRSASPSTPRSGTSGEIGVGATPRSCARRPSRTATRGLDGAQKGVDRRLKPKGVQHGHQGSARHEKPAAGMNTAAN
jgi:hypothetical protein